MRGRQPLGDRLCEADRPDGQAIGADGQLRQRVANRARALLALARGARLAESAPWRGWSRMGLWP
jgi:hypothetical protein